MPVIEKVLPHDGKLQVVRRPPGQPDIKGEIAVHTQLLQLIDIPAQQIKMHMARQIER